MEIKIDKSPLGEPYMPPERKIECVTVFGQIEGHYYLSDNQKTTKYEELIPRLFELEQSDTVKGILLLLNTVGGDVEAGLSIAELIAGMTKPTASLVIGGSHSIGVPLAVCTEHSFIAPSAVLTVHPVRISGTVIGAPQSYRYFERMQQRISDFIISHSDCNRVKLEELMFAKKDIATDIGSILDGRDAVDAGLIDSVGTIGECFSYLENRI